jgi:dipeptidyl aminopeptidase/acylaminoacyl peptidase
MRYYAPFLLLFASAVAFAKEVSYTKDIVPLFEARCYGCHAELVKMGSLNLSTYDSLMQGGTHGPVLVRGKRHESRLYLSLIGKVSPLMPMDGTRLTEAQIDLIGRWIDAGAVNDSPAGVPANHRDAIPDIKPRVPVKPQIFSMAWRPDGRAIALGGYKEVRIVDPKSGRTTTTLTGHADAIRAVAYFGGGKFLAAAGGLPGKGGEVRIWDVDTERAIVSISGHGDCIYGLAISPDGQIVATASYDKLIKLWDVSTGKEIRTLKDHVDAVYSLAFTPDGSRLVSGAADRAVKVWNVATGERLYTMSEPLDGIYTIAVDPSGRFVAAGGLDKSIHVWELGDREAALLHSLMAHEDAILKLSWSPDSKYLISSSADRTVKILEAGSLVETQALRQADWAYGVEYSPDGATIAVGRFDGTLTLYDSVTYREVLAQQRASR